MSRILLTLEQTFLAISDGEAGFYGGAEPAAGGDDGGKGARGKKRRHNATDVHDGLILVLEDEARDWEDEARRLRGELDIKNAELVEIRRRAKAFDVLPQYRAAVFKARSLAQSLRLRLAEEQNDKELLKQQLEDARMRVEEGFRAMELQSDRFVSAIGARMRAGKGGGRSGRKKVRRFVWLRLAWRCLVVSDYFSLSLSVSLSLSLSLSLFLSPPIPTTTEDKTRQKKNDAKSVEKT